jgi:hypothetical protein
MFDKKDDPVKTKYRTGKDLYRWSRGKSRSFLLTLEFFSVLINELAFHGTNGSPILPICIQYSLDDPIAKWKKIEPKSFIRNVFCTNENLVTVTRYMWANLF